MNSKPQRKTRPRFWRRLRIYFRAFRIAVLLLLFLLVCAGAYLNEIGLPDFIKQPVLDNLRSHGVNLEFTRLRLRWYRGIVAEDVRLLGTNNPTLPEFSARSADVQLDHDALRHLKLEVRGVALQGGYLDWPAESTNAPRHAMTISNITAQVHFLPGDEWRLENLQAEYLGARFSVEATLTNASSLRQLISRPSPTPHPPGTFFEQLLRIHRTLARIEFTRPPEFQLLFSGDATNINSFTGVFTIKAPDARTPWGEFQNGQLQAKLNAADSSMPHKVDLTLTAGQARTRWASLRDLDLKFTAAQQTSNQWHCLATLLARSVGSEWASAGNLELEARWLQLQDTALPPEGNARLRLQDFTSRHANAAALNLEANFRPAPHPLPDDPALGFWTRLPPYALDLNCTATNITTTNAALKDLALTAQWNPPHISLTNLQVHLAQGGFDVDAALDVIRRQLDFSGRAHFDFHELAPLLTEKSREWIDSFTWETPPEVTLSGLIPLPAWTNRQPDWRGEVQPGIVLNGAVSLTNGGFVIRGIPAQAVTTHLHYSNRVWRLPDLALTRPEGTLRMDLMSDEVSHDFAIGLRGPLDPGLAGSFLNEQGRRGLGYFEYTAAPQLDFQLGGNWYEPERLAARGTLTWTNFSYRAQHADWLEATLTYSNKRLLLEHPLVLQGDRRALADSILFDFPDHRAYLTNGFTDIDPVAITTAIGPKVAAAVEPYQFLRPPAAHVNGIIPLKGEEDADLHFDLDGGPFHWTKFNLPHVKGHVCWANQSVTLSNFTASFYGGTAEGNAWFKVSERGSTPYHFDLTTTNADLHALMADLHSPTNQLEGTLNGRLVVTSANTTNWNTWNGYGRADLHNGLIWDSPIFGVMSSVMNTLVPGIGNSRASEAGGTYTITNSIIHTRDLDIRASGMRLLYTGTVDFNAQVDARVQAELLRDTWLIGRIMSAALWPVSKIFEYRVTGTLAEPKLVPVYLLPKIFLAPLTPVKSIKGLFQETPASTNAPAATP